MAIDWGAWEGASPNRLRIGIDVSWEAISHGETAATATIKVYLDAEGNWSDTQTITFTGSISGSVTFSNNQDNNNVLRATKSYTYNYSSSSYGSSPGSRTFGASLSGAFNGATPSNSVSSNIPARPYGAPAAPTNVNTSRVSESSAKTTWTNKDTAGEPWSTIRVQYDAAANDVWNGDVGTVGGSGTSFTDTGLSSNYAYRWRVRAENSVGDSAWVEGDLIYTTPAAPTNLVRTGLNGQNQVLTWTNNVSAYVDNRYRVERSVNGGAWVEIASGLARDSTTYTDTYGATHPTEKIKYRVRANTNGGAQGTLYSGYSNESTETTGVTTPPNAPTNLSPAGLTVINPKFTKTFTWTHNPTDTSAQTKYQFQWRVGAGAWNTLAAVASAVSSYTSPASTFPDNSTVEWQVRTWGAATTDGSDGTGASPWSASAFFKTVGDPNLFRERRRVMRLNLDTGKPESAPVGVLPPIGAMMAFGGNSAPSGWLFCDGSLVSTTTFADLFGVIGHAYNAGVDPGGGQFKLPDFRSRFPRGGAATATPGAAGGSSTIATANLPVHAHDMTHDHDNLGMSFQYSGTTATGGTANRVTDIRNATGGSGTGATAENNWIATYAANTGNAGSGTAYWQPYMDVNYIIKS